MTINYNFEFIFLLFVLFCTHKMFVSILFYRFVLVNGRGKKYKAGLRAIYVEYRKVYNRHI